MHEEVVRMQKEAVLTEIKGFICCIRLGGLWGTTDPMDGGSSCVNRTQYFEIAMHSPLYYNGKANTIVWLHFS
jgi:hypothetical protein